MLYVAIFLGVLLAVGLLFLFVPTYITVDYLYENKARKLKIRFRVLGIPISVQVPLGQQAGSKKSSDVRKGLSVDGYIDYVKKLYEAYQETKEDIRALLADIKENLGCREVLFTLHYGTKNPAATGMLNGAVWTASSLILKMLDEALHINQKTLQIYPDFQKARLCLHIKGTFRFTILHALRFVLKVNSLVNIIKRRMAENAETH